ncbi:hypothetical protein NVS55_05345 [Myxococcus stipitatus]|uniref:hypothetical protein n=1 Tax=Myxococcus stipitatus TaxID=83455 RepID=UPI003144F2EB
MPRQLLFGALLVSSLCGGAALAQTTVIDVISPARCTPTAGRLTRCSIPTQTLTGTDFMTAVPMRTVVQRTLSGNCSTQYPLEVMLTPVGGSATRYSFLSTPSIVLRGLDRQLLTSIELKDSSTWTSIASFADTCRVSLNIDWNQVDVDSSSQAQTLIQDLQADLAAKTLQRNNLEALLDFSTAYNFMGELSNRFYAELTTETMMDLRAKSMDSSNVLLKVAITCEQPAGTPPELLLTDADRELLNQLFFNLGTLGGPGDYTHPDGSLKTVRDFLGDEAKVVIDKLAGRSTPAARAQYQAQYQAAALAVVAAQQKLDLARLQLAPWLTP